MVRVSLINLARAALAAAAVLCPEPAAAHASMPTNRRGGPITKRTRRRTRSAPIVGALDQGEDVDHGKGCKRQAENMEAEVPRPRGQKQAKQADCRGNRHPERISDMGHGKSPPSCG